MLRDMVRIAGGYACSCLMLVLDGGVYRDLIGAHSLYRNRIVHHLMGLDYDILREAATRHIPSLVRDLEAIVPPVED
jgi:uncharacterized protein YutE (UPF0331/DUF86 family)